MSQCAISRAALAPAETARRWKRAPFALPGVAGSGGIGARSRRFSGGRPSWAHRPPALHKDSVGLIVKRAAARIGLDAAEYAGHSLRAGLATQAYLNGPMNWPSCSKTATVAGYRPQVYPRQFPVPWQPGREAWALGRLSSQSIHDVAEAGAADLVIRQQPALVDEGKRRVRGRRILSIAPRLDIDDRRLDAVFLFRGLSDFSREFRYIRTLARSDHGQASAIPRDLFIPTFFECRITGACL